MSPAPDHPPSSCTSPLRRDLSAPTPALPSGSMSFAPFSPNADCRLPNAGILLLLPLLLFFSASPTSAADPPASPAPAATPASAPPTKPADTARLAANSSIETYLERHGLKALLAEHLAARLALTPRNDQAPLGERLGLLYVELMATAPSPDVRAAWEAKAADLVKRLPEAASVALRIDLLKTRYLQAEDAAERFRLRAVPDAAKPALAKELAEIKEQFDILANEAHRRAENLERLEDLGRLTDKQAEDLADARRIRSMAFYYAGWSGYYSALVGGNNQHAADALRAFAWILWAGAASEPNLQRLVEGQLKYDHIARAAVGTALALSLRGRPDDALRWISVVDNNPETPAAIKQHLLARRIAILGNAPRWPALDTLIRSARAAPLDQPASRRLDPIAARLLAIVALEADPRAGDTNLTQALARAGMQDLIAAGQTADVLAVARRFGPETLGQTGFIATYVRGMLRAEAADAALAKLPDHTPDQPAPDGPLRADFLQAAELLDLAAAQPDATGFASERAEALLAAGRAHFLAGRPVPAAERFVEAARLTDQSPRGEEALWRAVAALDRVVSAGETRFQPRLDELVTLYLRAHPTGERAAQLLVRRAGSGALSDDESLRILLGIPDSASVYEPARRQAARILYRLFRATPESQRALAAGRFLPIAEDLLARDRRALTTLPGDARPPVAQRATLTARQMLDALLSTPAPDPRRAEELIPIIEELAPSSPTSTADLQALKPELAFRRLQILLSRDQLDAAEAAADQLRSTPGPFADAADRALYQRALLRFRKPATTSTSAPAAHSPSTTPIDPTRLAAAKQVVRFGLRLIDRFGSSPAALTDAGVLSLHRSVAAAAHEVFAADQTPAMRDLALQLERAILAAAPPTSEGLIRLAELAEAAGDSTAALDAWRQLFTSLPEGSPDWFKSRYNSARLLSATDPARALDALTQHVVLHPDYGPAPWGDRLRILHARLLNTVRPGTSAPTAPAGKQPAGTPPAETNDPASAPTTSPAQPPPGGGR